MRKKSKKIKKNQKQEDIDLDLKLNKIAIISDIDRLKNLAQNNLINDNIDDAIYNAEKIIRIAIKYDMPNLIREQEEFINSIAQRIQKEYEISEIKKAIGSINKIYNSLLNIGNISQAHEIFQKFKDNYDDVPIFETIPEVQELIENDRKIWVNYLIKNKNEN